MPRFVTLAAFALALVCAATASAREPPRVVASILPVHSLVAGVMEGVGRPRLLVAPGASPHEYQMRPSEARALSEAELVVWVGPELEAFLARPLASLASRAVTVELMRAPGVELLPARAGGGFEPHRHDAEAGPDGDDGHDHPAAGAAPDPHVWLSPANAKAIAQAVADALAGIDPVRAELYRGNAERLASRVDALAADLSARLAPVRGRTFVVAHDAYQYLEHAFGLRAAGSITAGQERPPGAARMAALRQALRAAGPACVMAEARAGAGGGGLAAALAKGAGVAVGVLDAEGSGNVEPSPAAWFEVMRRNADALAGCLSGAGVRER